MQPSLAIARSPPAASRACAITEHIGIGRPAAAGAPEVGLRSPAGCAPPSSPTINSVVSGHLSESAGNRYVVIGGVTAAPPSRGSKWPQACHDLVLVPSVCVAELALPVGSESGGAVGMDSSQCTYARTRARAHRGRGSRDLREVQGVLG